MSVARTDGPRPLHEWGEDDRDVLWWLWPIVEAPYVGTPLDLGRTVSFDATVQIGIDVYEVEPKKVGMTGGWPWSDADDDTKARLFWTPLPDPNALDVAIRDHIRGGTDPEQPTYQAMWLAPRDKQITIVEADGSEKQAVWWTGWEDDAIGSEDRWCWREAWADSERVGEPIDRQQAVGWRA